MTTPYAFPVAKLTNGIVVLNFGSRHEYRFSDGTVLDYCLDTLHGVLTMPVRTEAEAEGQPWADVKFEHILTDEIMNALVEACQDAVDTCARVGGTGAIVLVSKEIRDAVRSLTEVPDLFVKHVRCAVTAPQIKAVYKIDEFMV